VNNLLPEYCPVCRRELEKELAEAYDKMGEEVQRWCKRCITSWVLSKPPRRDKTTMSKRLKKFGIII
jgi:hypothetical protein